MLQSSDLYMCVIRICASTNSTSSKPQVLANRWAKTEGQPSNCSARLSTQTLQLSRAFLEPRIRPTSEMRRLTWWAGLVATDSRLRDRGAWPPRILGHAEAVFELVCIRYEPPLQVSSPLHSKREASLSSFVTASTHCRRPDPPTSNSSTEQEDSTTHRPTHG